MNELILILTLCAFFIILLVTSRFFYLLDIKTHASRVLTTLNLTILELNYSFEQISYFYTLPSNIPILKNAKIEDISIEFDYNTILFQQLKGIKIYVKSSNNKILLAYLTISDFRLPSLDVLMEKEKINENSYLKISIYKLTHPVTINQIKEEVYKQMQIGRYEQVNNPKE